MNIAILPARKGSKRIPQKNIADINGRPSIVYPIEVALNCPNIDAVYVSTDCKQIAEIAIEAGAQVPFIRDKQISDDYTGVVEVIKNFLIELGSPKGAQVTNVCVIYPTAVLTQISDIVKAYETLTRENVDYCFGATKVKTDYLRSFSIDGAGGLSMLWPDNYARRSQDLGEEMYRDAGQFYWGKKASWLAEIPMYGGNSRVQILKSYHAIDLDDADDLELMRYLFKGLNSDL